MQRDLEADLERVASSYVQIRCSVDDGDGERLLRVSVTDDIHHKLGGLLSIPINHIQSSMGTSSLLLITLSAPWASRTGRVSS